MSLALKWDDENGGGLIYFDAVTSYSQDYSGKVTQHPIDAGGNVTDHYFKSNPRFKIGGVISGIDISTGTYLIQDLEGNLPYNANEAPTPVSINSTDQSLLNKFLPDSIGQFLSDDTPEVVVESARTDLLEQIREALISLTSGEIINNETGQFNPNIQLIDLYEYDGFKLSRVVNRLVMTNVSFRETPDSGYALYCDFSFEQVTFASLKKADIPQDVRNSLKKKAAPKSSKGKQDSTVQDVGTGDNPPKSDIDPYRPRSQGGITDG